MTQWQRYPKQSAKSFEQLLIQHQVPVQCIENYAIIKRYTTQSTEQCLAYYDKIGRAGFIKVQGDAQ